MKKDFLNITPQSYWLASTDKTDYPTLQEDLKVDVAIIGGGMTGITTALLLKKEGLKVAIIEADGILQGTTGHTTAKITSQHGLIYDKMKGQVGEELARQYAAANESAIHLIADLVKEKDIDCDFSWQPAFVYTQSDAYVKKIQNEVETAASLGIKATYTEDLPLPFPIKAAVRFEGQAQFHPRKYLLALAKEIPGDGSYIYENTKAVDIEERNPAIVTTDKGHRIFAFNVIIASHYPFYDKPGFYFSRLYPERSYVLGLQVKEKFPGGMFISAEEPTRSLRSQVFEDKELILLSGEHHKTGHGRSTLSHYKNLEEFANKNFEVEDILFRWSTQDYSTPDGLPYIGQLTSSLSNIYVATGFQKWGMTNSTVSAMLLKDLIVKRDSPWASVYHPSRFTPAASASNFIVENIDVAINFVSGKILPAAADQNLQPNEAKVLEIEGKKVGAYRDEKGELHLVDTTCTHMYCEVKWNDAEKTWDCPCHGSRFSCEGDIVEGPALKPLTKYK
ncbi:glycine/D-amino acid oxidases [Clostridium aceticum]|uniref:Glycine/D-amino acid oxidases n=1 Tax=Clostridium aceticum TaxID=84022 RepID=A0A0D8I867_9CLOT|nr:FAD-dependent oxidoreductase [Clostridium aceticum]AKL97198.1 glycine/D-amino acid oxidases [Clostridium aceticum]KJF26232.1 (2Fe-2S)-binding protein [Clostridium aceticum]